MVVHYAIAGMEAPCGVHRRRELVLRPADMRRRPGGRLTALATTEAAGVTCRACRRILDYCALQRAAALRRAEVA